MAFSQKDGESIEFASRFGRRRKKDLRFWNHAFIRPPCSAKWRSQAARGIHGLRVFHRASRLLQCSQRGNLVPSSILSLLGELEVHVRVGEPSPSCPSGCLLHSTGSVPHRPQSNESEPGGFSRE